jgi:molybdopterin converting factor small subunit
MISLKLHYEPPFSMLTKTSNETVQFDKELKLIELIKIFEKKYGQKFSELIWDKEKKDELHKMLSIIVNGITYRHDKFLETTLKDGDDISFIYIFFGG